MSNKRWNPLPPISRTPSPPPHILHRLQSYGGGALPPHNEDPEDPEWHDEGPSTPAATGVEPPRKKRKTKKRFLSSRKDPEGKWRRRKEREIGRAMEKEEEDKDMLDSIKVAGGFIMIGEGSGGLKAPSLEREAGKKKQGSGKSGSGVKGKGRAGKATAGSKRKGGAGSSKMEVPSQESKTTYTTEKTTLGQGGALGVSGFDQENSGENAQIPELLPAVPSHLPGADTPMPDLPYEIPSSIQSSDSGTLTPPNGPTPKLTNPTPPKPPPNPEMSAPAPLEPKTPSVPPSVTWSTAPPPPPPNPNLNELAKQLIFHICAFPDLRRTWTISGRDLYPTTTSLNHNFPTRPPPPASPTTTTLPASASPPALEMTGAGPSYITLSLILTRKLSIPATPSRRILINYYFIISTQKDLDECMARLVYYARPIHDIALVSTGGNTRTVINALRSRDRDFWKGRKKDSQLPEAALIAAENLAGGAEVSSNRRDGGAGGGKRASRGRGKEGNKDERVLSSEFVEPEDDYSEDEDMGIRVEAPNSIFPSPAELKTLQVMGTLVPGVEKESQKVVQIPPAPAVPRSGPFFEAEMEKVTSTIPTHTSTQGGSAKKLATPVPTLSPGLAASKRQQETRKETGEVKPLQKPTQTQYVGHVSSNERSNPSPIPTIAGGGVKRKLDEYFDPLTTLGSVRSKKGASTAAFSVSPSPSRWRSGAVEMGTQTSTPTRAGAGDAITIVGSGTNEWKGKGKSKVLTPSTSSSKIDVPSGVAEKGKQKTSQKASNEQAGESSGSTITLVAVQERDESSASPAKLQVLAPALMPLVISEKQTCDPTPRIEGPDSPGNVAPLEAIGVRHEIVESGEVLEKERRGEGGGEGPVSVTEPEMAETAADSGLEEDSGPLNMNEEGNRLEEGDKNEEGGKNEKGDKDNEGNKSAEGNRNDEGNKNKEENKEDGNKNAEEHRDEGNKDKERNKDEMPGNRTEKEKDKEKNVEQPRAQEVEIAPEVAISGTELAIVPRTSEGGGSPMAAFQASTSAAETADGAETETQKNSPVPAPDLPTLPTLPAETGDLLLPTSEVVRTDAVEESAGSAPEALKSPLAEDESLPTRTPSLSPPRSSPRMQTPSPPAQTHERFKAFVAAAAAAANDSGLEPRVGNCERAAGDADDTSKAANEQEISNGPQKENGEGEGDEDGLGRELVHDGRASIPPMPPTEESGSEYSPSDRDSVTNSTLTDIAEKDVPLKCRNEDEGQRSERTAEAAVMLSAFEAPPFLRPQPPTVISNDEVEARNVREDSRQSVDIMHGADLLLWAAGAVDASFGQHVPPPQPQTPIQLQQESIQHHETSKTIVSAPPAKGKPKQKKPKDSKESEVLNEAKVTKTKVPQRKSLVVTLKVPSIPNSVDGDPTTPRSPPNGMVTTSNSPPLVSPPNLPVSMLGLTPVNTPAPPATPPIPRPRPYRKPEPAAPRPIAMKPLPRPSSVEALAAARKAKTARFNGIGSKSGNNNNPDLVGASTPVTIQPTSITPIPGPSMSTVQPTSPRASPAQAATTLKDIPRPAYAKPSSGNARNPQPPDIDMDDPPTVNDALPLPPLQPPPVTPRARLPAQPPTQKFFTSINNGSQNEILDRAPDSPPLPLPPQRATLTPEYIESKKVVPLVDKSNFLYWDPSMAKGVSGAEFKVQIGETVSTSISPITASPALGPRSGSVAGPIVEGRSFYQSPPLRPLSDTVRSTTAPLLQPRAQMVPTPRQYPQSQVQPALSLQIPPQPLPQQQRPSTPFTPPSALPNAPLKPADMVFNISRYEKGDQNMVVHGHDILADSPEAFSWDKLVKLLETGIQFDDFRESLIINFHHMVEDEAALNEGLRWYRKDNEVVAAKVDSMGKPPKLLAERMKKERKTLRERDFCGSPVR